MKIQDPNTGKSFFRKLRQRYDLAGHAREFTFSCYNSFQFFSRERTCHWFIDSLASVRERHSFDLWAYVIMPEHVHLLVYPREPGMKMGPMVGAIKEHVASLAIRHLERHAPEWLTRITVREGKRVRRRFWQPGGGYDRNGVEIQSVLHMINYIHMNPVRRGLVGRPEEWYWSSAGWYAGLRPVPIEMDQTIPMFDYHAV